MQTITTPRLLRLTLSPSSCKPPTLSCVYSLTSPLFFNLLAKSYHVWQNLQRHYPPPLLRFRSVSIIVSYLNSSLQFDYHAYKRYLYSLRLANLKLTTVVLLFIFGHTIRQFTENEKKKPLFASFFVLNH